MGKLLVTGASGFLGWHVCQLAQQQGWEVYGTYHTHPVEIPGVLLQRVDLKDFAELKQLLEAIQPTAVIHTAAQSKPNTCQVDPDGTYEVNVTASCNLAGLCGDRTLPYIFTSTDQVFNGQAAPYRETDPVSPLNHYGTQKVAAEVGILERYPNAAVCRMPLMFGAAPIASNFLQLFAQTLRAKQELRLFADEFRTPVGGHTAAQGLLWAIAHVQGLIHLGGKERISRYEFGCLMVEVLELPTTGLRSCSQKDVPMAAPRPPDVSLDSSKAFSLGYAPPPIRAELTALKGQL